MNQNLLNQIIKKLQTKYSSVTEQLKHMPKSLTSKEINFIKSKLRNHAYYKELKQKQLEEREQQFYETFTINNPYKSKDKKLANFKERVLMREALYKIIPKQKLLNLVKNYVISYSKLSSIETKILTDSLLISLIDKRLRPYKICRATKLGSNKFAYYLIKENWKNESINHLVWKFELKRLFKFHIEQPIKNMRVDLLKKNKKSTIFCEIVCSRQVINQHFKEKISKISKMLKEKDKLLILAPVRLHKHLKQLCNQEKTVLANTKNILTLLKRFLAQK